jgi:fumarate reductase subunit D
MMPRQPVVVVSGGRTLPLGAMPAQARIVAESVVSVSVFQIDRMPLLPLVVAEGLWSACLRVPVLWMPGWRWVLN